MTRQRALTVNNSTELYVLTLGSLSTRTVIVGALLTTTVIGLLTISRLRRR